MSCVKKIILLIILIIATFAFYNTSYGASISNTNPSVGESVTITGGGHTEPFYVLSKSSTQIVCLAQTCLDQRTGYQGNDSYWFAGNGGYTQAEARSAAATYGSSFGSECTGRLCTHSEIYIFMNYEHVSKVAGGIAYD